MLNVGAILVLWQIETIWRVTVDAVNFHFVVLQVDFIDLACLVHCPNLIVRSIDYSVDLFLTLIHIELQLGYLNI